MEKFVHTFRVRYAEADQMGFVYHGNYSLYYDLTRTEMIRSAGLSYKDIEASGIAMPVVNMNINFRAPAHYDDVLKVECYVKGSIGRKVCFHAEIFNEKGVLINTSEITLVFIDTNTLKSVTCPDFIKKAIEKYIHD